MNQSDQQPIDSRALENHRKNNDYCSEPSDDNDSLYYSEFSGHGNSDDDDDDDDQEKGFFQLAKRGARDSDTSSMTSFYEFMSYQPPLEWDEKTGDYIYPFPVFEEELLTIIENNDLPALQLYVEEHRNDARFKTFISSAFHHCNRPKYDTLFQWLMTVPEVDVHMVNESAFRNLCDRGELVLAQRLLELHPSIDIHALQDGAFVDACEQGHLEIAQWLVSLGGVNIRARNRWAFRHCEKHEGVKKWLAEQDV